MVTPLEDQDKLDNKGIERLIEHLIEGGVHGLFILGTTGEAVSLSYRLRFELIERVCKQVSGRIPVLVGITDTSLSESLRMADMAARSDADAVVAAPPYYFTPTQDELRAYFNSLAEELPLPLFLYNMPSHTKIQFETETISDLADQSNIIGLKDSSADLIHFQKIVLMLKDRPDFTLLAGPEQLLMQTVLMGGHGGVNGGANMFPRLYVGMYEAAIQRDFDRIKVFQKRIMQISSEIYSVDYSGNSALKGIKCALSIMEICNDYIAAPLSSLNTDQREKIEGFLKNLSQTDIH